MKKRIKISALSASCMLLMTLFTGCGSADNGDMFSMSSAVKKADEGSAEAVAKDEGSAEIAGEAEVPDADTALKKADDAVADIAEGAEDVSVAPEEDIIIDEEYTINENGDTNQAGLLTAGRWNDNQNWGFFRNLVNAGTIEFPVFNINPVNRTEVNVKNESGEPSVNVKVELLSADGSVIWTSLTDKNGKAYLFYETDNLPEKVRISFGEDSQEYAIEINNNNSDGQGSSATPVSDSTDITFSSQGELYPATDIMFIVDSTGSMSDEMLFLQSEFSAIAQETGTDNIRYSVNFYRDIGDEYVTKCFDFTDDISSLQETLNSERADGGGDTPEAVTEILDETMNKSDWGEKSVKLAFMIFDAPPHSDRNDLDVLNNAVKTASERGIRIIPVVSSNSERDTELFGRALSICTNGEYVFLTDDSGIGGSHLEPIIGDYQVEKLYDIIIKIIDEYKQ